MALANPQLQWSLDQSAGSLFTIGRRFIEAATSDNVQILALMTCESFGATLPVGTITRLKVETLARRNVSSTVSFLKAQIGYRAGDSADALSKSDGGLRFLCLAAILCTFDIGFISAAQALDKMIRSNSNGVERFPTMLQLRDLLKALSPKLSDSGFTADVIGWTQLCAPDRRVRSLWQHDGSKSFITPGEDEFGNLLEAVQQCYRVGDANMKAVVNADIQYIPWTIAVLKWLTGATPSVKKLDGSMLLSSNDNTITIEEDAVPGRYLVSLLTHVESVNRLISTKGYEGPGIGIHHWLAGFLDASSWLRARLDAWDIDSDLASRVLVHVIAILPDAILLSESIHSTAISLHQSKSRQALARPFPNRDHRRRALSQMFPYQNFNENSVLEDVIQEIRLQCSPGCICDVYNDKVKAGAQDVANRQALGQQHNDDEDDSYRKTIHDDDQEDDASTTSAPSIIRPCFKKRIGSFIADVLVLMLFYTTEIENPYPELSYPDFRTGAFPYENFYSDDGIRLNAGLEHSRHFVAQNEDNWQQLVANGWWPILTGRWLYLSCTSQAIVSHVGLMLGHSKDPETNNTPWPIVLSRYGYVVYPLVLDVGKPVHEGFLRLVKRSGQLWWNEQTFSGIVARKPSILHPMPIYLRTWVPRRAQHQNRQIDKDFVPVRKTASRLTYHIGIGRSTEVLNMIVTDPSPPNNIEIQPWDLLSGLSQTLFSLPCEHSPLTPVGTSATTNFSAMVHYEAEIRPRLLRQGDEYLLFDLNGKPSHQLIQLAVVNGPCLVFSQGCIGCALTFAKKHGVKLVIC